MLFRSLNAAGDLLERPSGPPLAPEPDVPLGPVWRGALAALLPLEATPLLAPAIARVWPSLDVVWGPVWRDLIEARGEGLRLALGLVRSFAAMRPSLDGGARRDLARTLVRDVLGLVGPPVREAAARWLAAQSPPRQAALLEAASQADRQTAALHAAEALAPLLDALTAGEGVPGVPGAQA